MNAASPDVAFVADNSESNSLGRAYCLWLLTQELGLRSVTIAASGSTIWRPLDGTEFAKTIVRAGDLSRAHSAGVIICVKPLPKSLRLSLSLSTSWHIPIVLDIDDPDIEAGLAEGDSVKRIAKSILRPRDTWWFTRARDLARDLPTIVSNPYLEGRYGGIVIPHVRPDLTASRAPDAPRPTMAFVGTNRPHKGVDLLRSAVAHAQEHGYRLVVTDSRPKDAQSWEDWVGQCSLQGGLDLVASSDVVAIPSNNTPFSRGQLPVKLVDAMLLGRAVIASDLPAVAWALGDTGKLVRPGDLSALLSALDELSDPTVRIRMGRRARRRALEMFSVASNAPKLAAVLRGVL